MILYPHLQLPPAAGAGPFAGLDDGAAAVAAAAGAASAVLGPWTSPCAAMRWTGWTYRLEGPYRLGLLHEVARNLC